MASSNAEVIHDELEVVPWDKEDDVRDCEMQEEPTSIFGEDFEHLRD